MCYVVQLFTGGFILHVKMTGLDLCVNNCTSMVLCCFQTTSSYIIYTKSAQVLCFECSTYWKDQVIDNNLIAIMKVLILKQTVVCRDDNSLLADL